MEWTGSERTLSSQSEQSSLLDLSCNVTPESFLLKPNPGKDDLPPSPEVDAGIHSAPVENDDHTGEMITRCIIEVLLNSLSKANAPLINPQCKELLKKSDQQKQKEQNIHQDMELDTRTLSESEELSKQSEGTVREEQDVSEEEFKRQAEGDAKWHLEAKKHGGSSNQQTASRGTPYALDRAHKEDKKNENEKGTEEDSDKRNHHNGDGGKEKKASEEVESEPLEKKSILTSGKVNEDDYKHSHGQKYVEEIIQSQERENEDSKEEEEEEEEKEEEEESNEKYHHSFHEEFEDSSEREDGETEKQDHKSGHYRRNPRLGKSSEYNSHHNGEKRDSPEELSEEESEFWDKRSHHPNHYYERGHYFVEPKNSIEMQRSEEMERESRSKGYWDQHYTSQEDNDEDMKHHSRENERKQYQYMRKRLFGGPSREMRHHYEVRMPYSKAREENGGKKQSYDSIDEKRHHDQSNVQLEEMPKPLSKEREDGEQRLNSQEAREEKHYPSIGEGELETTHYSERGKHFDNKRTLLLEEGYPRSHYLVENVKRALNPYYYQQPRWKNRSVDKNADTIDPLLESEEERKSRLNKKEFFPEYNDYDLWEKKQILDGLNHKEDSNNNPERLYKPEVKRQYDRMDELAHLLSYRKKSAEFPELYSSKEDIERGHIKRSGKDKFNQRPLTPEEEKELENLAAMDLELQKIAEKFNNNQRG
ncbi:secretogranin-1 isoform 2-T3 [Liasis olivaceus]